MRPFAFRALDVPPNYFPYHRLEICGNVFEYIYFLIQDNNEHPFLIGEVDDDAYPRVWISAKNAKNEWVRAISGEEIKHSDLQGSRDCVLDEVSGRHYYCTSVYVKGERVLLARSTGDGTAIIDHIDLRSFGQNFYCKDGALYLDDLELKGKHLKNLHAVLKLKPNVKAPALPKLLTEESGLATINRTPPMAVISALRREVGGACPIPGCGNPYLTWHHFNPPWRVEHHHRPEDMIALCREHRDKAEAGAFTNEQLFQFKREGKQRAREVRGGFDWMRRELVAVVGTGVYERTPMIVMEGDNPVIWLTRDDEGNMLLNVSMLTISGEPRAIIRENNWISIGDPVEIVCPPNGRKLDISYDNGDRLTVEFIPEAKQGKLSRTAVEVGMIVAGTGIEFGPHYTKIGNQKFQRFVVVDCKAGIIL